MYHIRTQRPMACNPISTETHIIADMSFLGLVMVVPGLK